MVDCAVAMEFEHGLFVQYRRSVLAVDVCTIDEFHREGDHARSNRFCVKACGLHLLQYCTASSKSILAILMHSA
jgi:hypothetical protein